MRCWLCRVHHDVARSGEWTAAICDDNALYLIDRQGQTRRLAAPAGYQVRFSPDSKSILSTSSDGKVSLRDVATGNVVWSYQDTRDALRNVRWSPDGSRITVAVGSQVVQLTSGGQRLWRHSIGEYPLYLAVDTQNNVYAAGKSKLLYSWDETGRLRWRARTMNTSNNTLNPIARDGSYLVAHSYNGELAAYDGGGRGLV